MAFLFISRGRVFRGADGLGILGSWSWSFVPLQRSGRFVFVLLIRRSLIDQIIFCNYCH